MYSPHTTPQVPRHSLLSYGPAQRAQPAPEDKLQDRSRPACTTHSLTRQPQSLGMADSDISPPSARHTSCNVIHHLKQHRTYTHTHSLTHGCTYAQKHNLHTWCLRSSLYTNLPKSTEGQTMSEATSILLSNWLQLPIWNLWVWLPRRKYLRWIKPSALQMPFRASAPFCVPNDGVATQKHLPWLLGHLAGCPLTGSILCPFINWVVFLLFVSHYFFKFSFLSCFNYLLQHNNSLQTYCHKTVSIL